MMGMGGAHLFKHEVKQIHLSQTLLFLSFFLVFLNSRNSLESTLFLVVCLET